MCTRAAIREYSGGHPPISRAGVGLLSSGAANFEWSGGHAEIVRVSVPPAAGPLARRRRRFTNAEFAGSMLVAVVEAAVSAVDERRYRFGAS